MPEAVIDFSFPNFYFQLFFISEGRASGAPNLDRGLRGFTRIKMGVVECWMLNVRLFRVLPFSLQPSAFSLSSVLRPPPSDFSFLFGFLLFLQ